MRDSRVLFVTRKYPPAVGGMENLSFEYAESLKSVAPTRVIALGRGQRNLVWFLPFAALRTFFAIARRRVHTLFVADALMFLALRPALWSKRVQVVVNVCGLDLTYPHRWYRALMRRALKRADAVIAISRATAEEAQILDVDPARITIVHPGIPVPPITDATRDDARATICKNTGLTDDAVILTTLGRLVARKGQAWFIRNVLPTLPERYHYVVAGTGSDLDAVTAAAAEPAARDRCTLLGGVDDAVREALLSGADVFVAPNIDIPGDMEGFGIVAAEAAVRGTPVVAARLEGLCDAVIEGPLGRLCEPGDARAFTTAITTLVDEGLAPEDRRAARETAADRFGTARFDRDVSHVVRGGSGPIDATSAEPRSHAVLDPESRRRKARKLVAILERRRALRGAALLEVGTGSGVMAAEMSAAVGPDGSVTSVDVRDERIERDGYAFVRVDSTQLPFDDAQFDVVVSNHVIEHVGDEREQRHHLAEVARVLRPDGIVYLAMPNRYGLLEPHYRLPFLSWLGPRTANSYVRIMRRGTEYDVRSPTRTLVNLLARQAGFDVEECSIEAARVLAALENPSAATRALAHMPTAALRLGLPVVPTMVFLLRRAQSVGGARDQEGKHRGADGGE